MFSLVERSWALEDFRTTQKDWLLRRENSFCIDRVTFRKTGFTTVVIAWPLNFSNLNIETGIGVLNMPADFSEKITAVDFVSSLDQELAAANVNRKILPREFFPTFSMLYQRLWNKSLYPDFRRYVVVHISGSDEAYQQLRTWLLSSIEQLRHYFATPLEETWSDYRDWVTESFKPLHEQTSIFLKTYSVAPKLSYINPLRDSSECDRILDWLGQRIDIEDKNPLPEAVWDLARSVPLCLPKWVSTASVFSPTARMKVLPRASPAAIDKLISICSLRARLIRMVSVRTRPL